MPWRSSARLEIAAALDWRARRFVDDHTVELTDKKGNVTRKTAGEHHLPQTD